MSGSDIEVAGWGAVSPAGWSAPDLHRAVLQGKALDAQLEQREAGPPVRTRRVPAWEKPPPWLRQPRLRRSSPISRFAVSAALEAFATETAADPTDERRLGIVFAVQNGSVNFSQRFFREVLEDPALASPIVFPETVFNAPSSHISSLLASPAANYTLVSDSGGFIVALDIAAQWLEQDKVSDCLVIGSEESDWLSSEALLLFPGTATASEGSAALWLRKGGAHLPGSLVLDQVTDGHGISAQQDRPTAIQAVRDALRPVTGELLVDACAGSPQVDRDHHQVWQDDELKRISLQPLLGHSFSTLGGWQSVFACEALRQPNAPESALIVADGGFLQTAGARLRRL